jgi:hypothetical protein
MSIIQTDIKRIMDNQKIRQALIEGSEDVPQGVGLDPSAEMISGLESIYDVLAKLVARQRGLVCRFISLFRVVWLGVNREGSAWQVFSAEYGTDDPITREIDLKANSVRLQRYTDHYQRRV